MPVQVELQELFMILTASGLNNIHLAYCSLNAQGVAEANIESPEV